MTATACDVCQRPHFGCAVPRDASTAAKHPLMISFMEEVSQGPCEPLDVYLKGWRVCIDCRPKIEDFLHQAVNGVLAGARRAFMIQSQKPRPKIKRRKR